jgi:hypothetical protein
MDKPLPLTTGLAEGVAVAEGQFIFKRSPSESRTGAVFKQLGVKGGREFGILLGLADRVEAVVGVR